MGRRLTAAEVAIVPGWGRPTVRAIAAARWASVAIADLPAHRKTVERLAEAGWVAIWPDLEGGDRATLTPAAASKLGVELDEAPRVKLAAELDYAGHDRLGVEKKPARTLARHLEDEGRWFAAGDFRASPRMDKVRGFVPLPFAAKVAAPPVPEDDDEPPPPSPTIQRLFILGRIAEALKPRSRSTKRKRRK